MGSSFNFDVIIAGGGPAGSSAAIHLAMRGARVLLAEQKKFPRAKLCGEFISPECLPHFEKLGVSEQINATRGAALRETVFYARSGNSVSVPSLWFGAGGVAVGMSRAEMDQRLLRRAGDAGVTVLEETQAVGLVTEDGRVKGARFKTNGDEVCYQAPITIDATGRGRVLARRLQTELQSSGKAKRRAPMVAFKAHFEGAQLAPGACEIYFYRGGYGGLSSIEGGLSNLCFIASARDVRDCGANAETVMRKVVCQNVRAAHTLAHAATRSEWLAVSLEGFGRRELAPADGLISIGDAASFIDPFTGSGMLMALESGELAAEVVTCYLSRLNARREFANLAQAYRDLYRERFGGRLRLCGAMRRAAFVPGLAEAAIRIAGTSDRLRRSLAMATRGGRKVALYKTERSMGRQRA